jgi:hypothetical protein
MELYQKRASVPKDANGSSLLIVIILLGIAVTSALLYRYSGSTPSVVVTNQGPAATVSSLP